MPSFASWLEYGVHEKVTSEENVSLLVQILASPLSPRVNEYLAMWTYKAHYGCASLCFGGLVQILQIIQVKQLSLYSLVKSYYI